MRIRRAAAVEAYRERNREVNRSSPRNKREYTKKTLTEGFTSKTTVVKDKHGKVLTKEQNQLDEWEEQFRETLNRPDPDVEAVIEYMGFQIEITRGNSTQQEIEKAIRQTKGNRAPGKDRVTGYMLKADPTTSSSP